MRKTPKAHLISVLIAIVAIGLIIFDQLAPSQPFPSHQKAIEEVAFLQGATDIQDEPTSLSNSTAHFPLQALRVEEIKVTVNQRLCFTYSLLSIALLLCYKKEPYQPKALFLPIPLCSSAPIYILLRQILI